LSLLRIISNRLSSPALRIISVVIAFVLISIPDLHAQYRVDTWTTDNGLPQNSITGLTQTPDQYLWLTTNDGLVRFDGNRFKIFNRSNTPQITTNRLSAAFADTRGRMWFQAEDGGILHGHVERDRRTTELRELRKGESHEYDYNERWNADLLQGLGNRPSHYILAWLAFER
jgi:ligand-binding sensor domain-containing protein